MHACVHEGNALGGTRADSAGTMVEQGDEGTRALTEPGVARDVLAERRSTPRWGSYDGLSASSGS